MIWILVDIAEVNLEETEIGKLVQVKVPNPEVENLANSRRWTYKPALKLSGKL